MTDSHWTVLVVDDEQDVLDVTVMVLEDVKFEGRGLRMLTASSAAEAKEVLRMEPELAVAFLDVVMETEHAGLDLVRFIRDELDNRCMRIVLRTGNPGAAPRSKSSASWRWTTTARRPSLRPSASNSLCWRHCGAIAISRPRLRRVIFSPT